MSAGEDIEYGTEKPTGYLPRVVDRQIERALRLFGAVEICGTKWCGKSWSSYAFGSSVTHVDDAQSQSLVRVDPTLALDGARPHVIDEWQEVPQLWDAVRRAIDDSGGERGQFILTGSSTPEKDKVTHSGAGRIARIGMSTMSLWEMGKSSGQVSLSGLFEGVFQPAQIESQGLAPLAEDICRGGWPALVGASVDDAAAIIDQYLDALYEVSVPKKGGTTSAARKVGASLARNVGTAAKLQTIADDAFGAEGNRSPTNQVSFYLELFKELYLIEELPGWDAPVRSKSRLRSKPKRYFADPSIPAAILGTSPSRLLKDGQLFGLLFESLCIHDLKIYVSALPGARSDSLCYYGDADGLEVDVIIELRDGRWAGIEIKLGEDKVPDGIANLARLRKKISLNSAARNPEPEFMAVLTASSPFARYDADHDVYVFPLASLRP